MPCLPGAHLHFGTEGATAGPHRPRMRSTGSAAQRMDDGRFPLKLKTKEQRCWGMPACVGPLQWPQWELGLKTSGQGRAGVPRDGQLGGVKWGRAGR